MGISGPTQLLTSPISRSTASGEHTPIVSTTDTSSAPCSMAVEYTSRRNPRSLRVESTAKKFTVFIPLSLACRIASVTRCRTISLVNPYALIFMSLVEISINTCSVPSSICASISAFTARENPQISDCSPASRIRLTAAVSSAETRGNPDSILSTPRSLSLQAISNFSSGVKQTPTDCSPSRNVVS